MTRLRTTILATLALAFSIGQAAAQTNRTPLVRIADLEIDPAQLPAYQAAVREEMSASIQIEPGVLAINCVAEKEAPNKLHFFEVYADPAAYEAHIASPHFRKYVDVTKSMITSRRLIETVPIQLSAKKS
ncbi:MAG: antibiotic biosynthesis monooxygenase [Oxalobacteraceae bacterium]|nr:MAG: antibiotic biosynthesis monooxygenase [Oxalobacteraceae bacterium]